MTDEVVDPDDVDRGDVRVHPSLAGECDDRVDLPWREADLGEGAFRAVHEVRETSDVVGDVPCPRRMRSPWTETSPGLRVDDEDAGAADDDHVDLGVLAPGP
ncbi:hypothetical protein [Curtobacterium sp. USHLN213]|uniref:hypothetical protein n=1 Tax=Curtobacterium sp. USHLN213 TaxID=3081255 RepID=UPI003019607C